MNANELMLEDWVYAKVQVDDTGTEPVYETIPKRVSELSRGINGIYTEDTSTFAGAEILPIPLTPEMLEKNGFKKLKYNGCGWILDTKEHNLFHDRLEITIELYGRLAKFNYTLSDYIPEEGYECWCGGDMDIDRTPFVHDLQHFYKLIGFNKEIIL